MVSGKWWTWQIYRSHTKVICCCCSCNFRVTYREKQYKNPCIYTIPFTTHITFCIIESFIFFGFNEIAILIQVRLLYNVEYYLKIAVNLEVREKINQRNKQSKDPAFPILVILIILLVKSLFLFFVFLLTLFFSSFPLFIFLKEKNYQISSYYRIINLWFLRYRRAKTQSKKLIIYYNNDASWLINKHDIYRCCYCSSERVVMTRAEKQMERQHQTLSNVYIVNNTLAFMAKHPTRKLLKSRHQLYQNLRVSRQQWSSQAKATSIMYNSVNKKIQRLDSVINKSLHHGPRS